MHGQLAETSAESHQLRAVDAKLLELMAERQRLAGKIGEVRRAAGKATRDYRQELEVVKRARKAGEALGLSGDVAEELMLMLIRSSLTVQEQAHVAVPEEDAVDLAGGARRPLGRLPVDATAHGKPAVAAGGRGGAGKLSAAAAGLSLAGGGDGRCAPRSRRR